MKMNFKKLTKNGLSMFTKAVEILERANQMMLTQEMRNCDTIKDLEKENSELIESRTKNNQIVKNIKNIID